MMFWDTFHRGTMGLGLFFQLNPGQKINSTIYRDQVLLGQLKIFQEESKNEIAELIVMEDCDVTAQLVICSKEANGRRRKALEDY